MIIFTSFPDTIDRITRNHKKNAPKVVQSSQDFAIQSLNKKNQIIKKVSKETGQVSSEIEISIEIVN